MRSRITPVLHCEKGPADVFPASAREIGGQALDMYGKPRWPRTIPCAPLTAFKRKHQVFTRTLEAKETIAFVFDAASHAGGQCFRFWISLE